MMNSRPAIQGGFTLLTRTKGFRKLTAWAFTQCDHDETGRLGREELYSGILLVHVHLAKYAGAAACYPPTRQVIDQLFDACDDDKSGRIDEEEFTQIMVICCAQITSRILVYYAIIILLVPVVANEVVHVLLNIDDALGLSTRKGEPFLIFSVVEGMLTWNEMAEKVVSLTLFMLVVPSFFNWIDGMSRKTALITEAPRAHASPQIESSPSSSINSMIGMGKGNKVS